MRLRQMLLIGCLGTVPALAEEPVSLNALLLRARDQNPSIAEARHAWKVAQAKVSPASAWPDPTLSYIDERLPSGVPGESPMKMRHLRVEQMIPFPGKLTSESRMLYHEAVMVEAAYRAKVLDVFRELRMRYYQLSLTDQKIGLATQSLEVLGNTLKTAQARLASGQSSGSDVFMAETELRKMENALFELQQQRLVTAIEVNALLNQPTDQPVGPAAKIELTDLPVSLADFQRIARRNTPEFVNAEHEVKHSQAQTAKSRLAWAPDFGVMYERETAPDGGLPGRQLGLSVTFPLWVTRPLGEIKATREHMHEAQSSAQAMETLILKNVHSEFVQTNTHLAMARRYEAGILPSSLSNLRVAREQYASGRGDFLRMLEAFRSWIEAQNMYQQEIYQYGEHWTELSRWIGMDASRAQEALEQNEVMPMEKSHGM